MSVPVTDPGAPHTLHAGEVFAGRYRLECPLGKGGMGTIWRARSLLLEIDVAVKVVHPNTSTQQDQDRLLREARAAASLGHPSIVRVFDFGTTGGGEPFLVMELLSGRSLGDWLTERGRLPATLAVQILLPVASALVAAHAHGIVHRDIKPENIMIVSGEGDTLVPKLVDFGIAKVDVGGQHTTTLTQTGALIGSPAYMSPEQARGQSDLDGQTDVWSLCVVLYELVTGRRPFVADNPGAIIFAIFADAPRPTTEGAAGDQALWDILRRGLEKAPDDRWPGMKSLGYELARWAVGHGVLTDSAGASIAQHWLLCAGSASDLDAAGSGLRVSSDVDRAGLGSRGALGLDTAALAYRCAGDTRAIAIRSSVVTGAAYPAHARPKAPEPGPLAAPAAGPNATVHYAGLMALTAALLTALFLAVLAFARPIRLAATDLHTATARTASPTVSSIATVVPVVAMPAVSAPSATTSSVLAPSASVDMPPAPSASGTGPPRALPVGKRNVSPPVVPPVFSAKTSRPSLPIPTTPDF